MALRRVPCPPGPARRRPPASLGRLALAGILASLPGAAPLSASGAAGGYWAAVALEAGGDRTGALARLREIPKNVQDAELDRLRGLARRVERCGTCEERMLLAQQPVAEAVLLHTDAAWQAARGGSVRRQALERARDLLDVIRVLPSGRAFALDWYRAVTLEAHHRMDWSTGAWVASEGLSRFEADPDLLLFRGTILETVGWRTEPTPKRARPFLKRAETSFVRAVRADPDAPEPRLRLAHVRWLLGQTRQVRQGLAELADAPGDAPFPYLARLFLGGVLEDEHSLPAAIGAYRAAVLARPDDQAARVALAHALFVSGDDASARGVMDAALALAGKRDDDPFWLYPWGHSGDAWQRQVLLRDEAGRCCH